MGCSMGGAIAETYLREFDTERVERLALMGTYAKYANKGLAENGCAVMSRAKMRNRINGLGQRREETVRHAVEHHLPGEGGLDRAGSIHRSINLMFYAPTDGELKMTTVKKTLGLTEARLNGNAIGWQKRSWHI